MDRQVDAGVSTPLAGAPITTEAPLTNDSRRFAVMAAQTAYPVLLVGETGVGKSHLARVIHRYSTRARESFVEVNCAALPASLVERELFGHVRGAFTDAKDSQPGFVEAAHRGTLFLDEIGELPMPLQPKLLTLIEERRFRRIGSTNERDVDLRLITATNRDLDGMVDRREFREDLFHRCAVLEHRVPTLRERRGEMPELIRWLLRRIVGPGAELPALAPEAERTIGGYGWPGNIRELDNALRHALAHTRNRSVEESHLPDRVRRVGAAPAARTARGERGERRGFERVVERYAAPPSPQDEVEIIRAALQEAGGNRTRAARMLGMSRSTLWAKLARYPGAGREPAGALVDTTGSLADAVHAPLD